MAVRAVRDFIEEREGFEPSALPRGGFQDHCLKPLGHLSGGGFLTHLTTGSLHLLRLHLRIDLLTTSGARPEPVLTNWRIEVLERWPRGRRRRFAKPLYGHKAVSRVRIPPSPPNPYRPMNLRGASAFSNLTAHNSHGIRVVPNAAIAQLDRAQVYETWGRKFESSWPHNKASGDGGRFCFWSSHHERRLVDPGV